MLHTSILDRMSGPLCDAVVMDPAGSGQETLAYLEHANLFIVPLDNERRWYRYHHLFADLLRQRLHQRIASTPEDEGRGMDELHLRASQWYEEQGLSLEAFHHATAAHDVERAACLVEGEGMPLHFRGAVTPVLHWLESLPKAVLDARPALWVMYASALTLVPEVPWLELWGWIGTLDIELSQRYNSSMRQKQEQQKMSLYIPLPLLERVRESAKKHRRSFNQEALWLIEQSLEKGAKDAQSLQVPPLSQ